MAAYDPPRKDLLKTIKSQREGNIRFLANGLGRGHSILQGLRMASSILWAGLGVILLIFLLLNIWGLLVALQGHFHRFFEWLGM
jgi:hypothetical protein